MKNYWEKKKTYISFLCSYFIDLCLKGVDNLILFNQHNKVIHSFNFAVTVVYGGRNTWLIWHHICYGLACCTCHIMGGVPIYLSLLASLSGLGMSNPSFVPHRSQQPTTVVYEELCWPPATCSLGMTFNKLLLTPQFPQLCNPTKKTI